MQRLRRVVIPALGLLAGCGGGVDRPATAPASGQVLLDGQPVAGAAISFVPVAGGHPATAETDREGRFRLSTFSRQDGAIVGDHLVAVTLVKSELPPGVVLGDDGLAPDIDLSKVKTEWIVPERYSTPQDSGLKASVPGGGTGALKFELSSK